ncbi:MAG: HEAT repeat domain-containing protein [Acidobacteriia bacterium]|nr:HEAT repeat domain-containing protein [Terriglobia bacterium]
MTSRKLLLSLAILLTGTLALAGQGLVSKLEVLLQLSGVPVPASSAVLSEHELEEINAMTPQDQVMRLVERTINHYSGAGEEIEKRAEAWIGQVHSTPELTKLTDVAYFSSDLRVRAAAIEIWRVEAGFRKTPETVQEIIDSAAANPQKKYFFASHLGILGNRGVERQRVFDTLELWVRDPDSNVRAAAINGLALLGTENTIPLFLTVFHDDPSHDLRERAACNLADSGLLSREQRKLAVPELVRFSQDPNLDATTKKWVYQALREITEKNISDDPAAWASWSGSRVVER